MTATVQDRRAVKGWTYRLNQDPGVHQDTGSLVKGIKLVAFAGQSQEVSGCAVLLRLRFCCNQCPSIGVLTVRFYCD